METQASATDPLRVSGIYLAQGSDAVIEGCTFVGGGGSAITILNDPWKHVKRVEILRSSFQLGGQPSFSPKRPFSSLNPGPAAVELWRLVRKLRIVRNSYRREEYYNTSQVRIVDNTFSHNLRAPLAYRCLRGETDRSQDFIQSASLVRGFESLHEVTEGFEVDFVGNTFESNGLGIESATLKDWTGEHASGINVPVFPDGPSLLSIRHVVEEDDAFVNGFECGIPTYDHDDFHNYLCNSSESGSEDSHWREGNGRGDY
jgi:hypothetical protein